MSEMTPAQKPTPRQLDVIQLKADGLTRREIAVQLCISWYTVKHRMCDAMRRVNARNETHLVILAAHYGWIDIGIEEHEVTA